MSRPTGFAAKCRCGSYVGALDAARTDRADMGKILGEWLFRGMTVEPRFTGTWSVELQSCRCPSQETSSARETVGEFIQRVREEPAVPPGHFWRGEPESNRHQCRNCGEHYDKHLHTDEASTCPPSETVPAPAESILKAFAQSPRRVQETRVGCEGDDGLLRIHSKRETCEICEKYGPCPDHGPALVSND